MPWICYTRLKIAMDDDIVQALKRRASRHRVSAEAGHRKILQPVLRYLPRNSFAEVLSEVPKVGLNPDFERIQDDLATNRPLAKFIT